MKPFNPDTQQAKALEDVSVDSQAMIEQAVNERLVQALVEAGKTEEEAQEIVDAQNAQAKKEAETIEYDNLSAAEIKVLVLARGGKYQNRKEGIKFLEEHAAA